MNRLSKNLLAPAFILLASLSLGGCKTIVNSLAFHPDSADVLTADQLSPGVEELTFAAEDGVQLSSLYLHAPNSDRLLIYFHGNAGNVYHRLPSLLRLRAMGVNVIGLSYRGYGKSAGSPSEQGVYRDGEAIFKLATESLGFASDNIILLGRSIGTTVAVDLAQNKELNGLILVTPLTTGKEMAKQMGMGWLSALAGDAFNSLAKIESVSAPLLVIHGTDDEVIPFEMGLALFAQAPSDRHFVRIEGGNHNDLHTQFETEYWNAIAQFLNGGNQL